MIISQLKHDDKKTLLIYDELFEIAIKQYKKNPTKEMHDKIHDTHHIVTGKQIGRAHV